jgi:transposase
LGDGDIPAFIELADGNQADKTRFAALMQEFKSQWNIDNFRFWILDFRLGGAVEWKGKDQS